MSLLTRLWLAVAGAMMLALAGAFGLTLLTARDYLTQQLFAQGNDGAAGLALTMSQQGTDKATATVLVSALFDSGHFEHVKFRDPSGNVVVERVNTMSAPDAPAWFARLFAIDARAGIHEVSAQWKRAGEVEVKANSRFAHAALWQGAMRLGGLMFGLAIALGLIMSQFVRWVKRPIERMVEQAEAIGMGQFKSAPESEVPELRTVGNAMNIMVNRVASMFGEQAARVEALREAANRDELSGLPNRGWFVGRLRDLLGAEAAAPDGMLLLTRVNDLGNVNRRLGRAYGDVLVQQMAGALKEIVANRPDALVARLNGADFALLLPGVGVEAGEKIASDLSDRLAGLRAREASDSVPVGFVGGAPYRRGEAPSAVLVRADNALMQGESGGPAIVRDTESAGARTEGRTPDAWRELLDTAIAGRRFALASYPVIGTDEQPLHREVMLRLLPPGGETAINAAQFVPAALRLDRIASVDLAAVELALEEVLLQVEGVAVNLSGVSVQQPAFLDALTRMLERAADRADRLWVEVSERSLSETHGVADLARLSTALAPFGCRLGIDHFGRDFAALPRLYEIRVDYLKIDGSFVAHLEEHPGNQRFIKAMVDVAESLDIAVYAEGVSSAAEWDALKALGVLAMTGPAAGLHLRG